MSSTQAKLPFPSNFRWYNVDGMILPSVTSILHEFTEETESLKKWKKSNTDWKEIMDFKAHVGTLVHNRIGNFFIDKYGLQDTPQKVEFEITDRMDIETEACLSYFNDFITKFKVEPHGIEIRSWHRKYKYAGTCDFVGLVNGVESLIDWKTSFSIYDSHKYQVVAYKRSLLSDKEFKYPIKRCIVVLVNARNGLKVGEIANEDKAWTGFMEPFNKFQMQYREPFERVEIGD